MRDRGAGRMKDGGPGRMRVGRRCFDAKSTQNYEENTPTAKETDIKKGYF
jgi:hypothetical protein